MKHRLSSLFPMTLLCILSACGGGGDETAVNTPPPQIQDLAADYVGTWKLACKVTVAPNSEYPEGISEDEDLTFTKVSETRLTSKSVKYTYNNSFCSFHTSHTVGFDAVSKVEIVGTSTSPVSDKFLFQPENGSAHFRALASVRDTQLFMTLSDSAGVALDAEGFPTTLDLSRGFTRKQ